MNPNTNITNEDPVDYELMVENPMVEDLFEPDITVTDDGFSPTRYSEDDFPELAFSTDRGFNTTFQQRNKAKTAAEHYGFESGTVVVKRSHNGYARINPENWGIVMTCVAYEDYGTSYYAPIKTKWLDGTQTFHYPDELIVVLFKPDDIDLGMIRRGEI